MTTPSREPWIVFDGMLLCPSTGCIFRLVAVNGSTPCIEYINPGRVWPLAQYFKNTSEAETAFLKIKEALCSPILPPETLDHENINSSEVGK